MGNMSEIKKIKINYNNLSLDTDKINDDFNANKLNKTKFKNLYFKSHRTSNRFKNDFRNI